MPTLWLLSFKKKIKKGLPIQSFGIKPINKYIIMKKLLVIISLAAFASCGDSATSTAVDKKDSTIEVKKDMIDSSADAKKDMLDSSLQKTKDSAKAVK